MFHVVIILIATCFGCTLYHFYAFSGINLLTRCHSLVPYFMLFFVSEILVRKYSRNQTKSITPSIKDGRDHGVERAPGGDPPGARAELWRGGPTRPPTSMYFVVMPNRFHSKHLRMYCIDMPSLFLNCPAVICLPNIASYLF